ncbi:MAG TPA: PIG-L deacetylase family protein [Gaiellaceae bacterium]|nr:PIG-L deacetylase family protein [Gaiellaceae bacterium]
MLGVFAHPDDESLLAGGVLAACAAAGRRMAIVSMTRGERGPTELPELVGREALGEARAAELLAAAGALGASSAECLDFPDGELADVDQGQAARALARLLERERPELVISFSEEGLYWHPDHLAVSRFLDTALELLGPAAPEWLYGATWPEGHAGRLGSIMRARGLPADLWGIEPDAFGAPADSVTTTLDVRRFLPAKLAALNAYASQIGPSHLLSGLPDDLADEFLGREYFVRIRPETSRRDLLAEALSNP